MYTEKAKNGLAWYKITLVSLYVFLVFTLVILWLFPIELFEGYTTGFDLAFLVMIVVYTAFGIKQVGPNERAALTLFGWPIANIDSGLAFVPPFICKLFRFSTNVQTLVIGSPREQPTKRNAEGKIDEFKFVKPGPGILVSDEPMRITSASYEAAEWIEGGNVIPEQERDKRFPKDDYLSRRSTFDPQVVTRFVVHDPCDHVKQVGETIEAAVPLISQATRATLQGFCGKRALSLIIHHLEDEAQERLRQDLEKLVGDPEAKQRAQAKSPPEEVGPPWGVDIQSVEISDAGLPFRLNEALADARAAGARKEATVTNAEAEKVRLTLEGEGAANAARLLLEAESVGFEKLAKILNTKGGKLAAQLDAMKTALAKGDNKLFFAGGQFSDLMESLTGAMAQLKAN